MDTLVVTFIYPKVEPFLNEFISSLNSQTTKEFKVLLFNDGVSKADLLFKNLDLDYQIINVSGSVKEVREEAFILLKKTVVKHIIFQDSDDLMSSNRVETCLKYLESKVLVCNDLDLIDTDGNLIKNGYWSVRLPNSFIFDYTFIKRFNIVGLGNTAIRRELLDYEIKFTEEEPLALDWFIFYQLLKKSKEEGIFVNTCTTIYRQHFHNLAGLGEFSEKRLQHAINVKKVHYNALIAIGFDFDTELKEVEAIEKKQRKDLKITIEQPLFWWEETEFIL